MELTSSSRIKTPIIIRTQLPRITPKMSSLTCLSLLFYRMASTQSKSPWSATRRLSKIITSRLPKLKLKDWASLALQMEEHLNALPPPRDTTRHSVQLSHSSADLGISRTTRGQIVRNVPMDTSTQQSVGNANNARRTPTQTKTELLATTMIKYSLKMESSRVWSNSTRSTSAGFWATSTSADQTVRLLGQPDTRKIKIACFSFFQIAIQCLQITTTTTCRDLLQKSSNRSPMSTCWWTWKICLSICSKSSWNTSRIK